MEHNNIYIYHQGGVDSLLGKQALFVFPYTETLTTDDVGRFLVFELRNKLGLSLTKSKVKCGWVSHQVLSAGFVQHKSKRAILYAYNHVRYINLNVKPMNTIARSYGYRKDNTTERKMNTMIKLYESIAEEKSPKELKRRLDAGGIFYYDAQNTAGVSTFDKRSPEGKALISAKRIVQREKLLAQRGYSINAKRRERSIDMSRLELQDNCKTITDTR